MDVPGAVWALTVVGVAGLLAFDFVFHVRKAHAPTLKEAAVWSGAYVGIAALFGLGVLGFGGVEAGSEYFAGYVTEKALSVDNLFVFLIIMASFRVPREDQQKVLLFGIVFALIARTGLIFLGGALIDRFAWIFYFFGLILLVTAAGMLRPDADEDSHQADNFVTRIAKKVIHTAEDYDGDKLFTILDGRRAMTPMLLVMVAIAGTDILFAFDSIPAVFGLTQDVYIVFTATAFSLAGLRQLYFLIDGLLHRIVYLAYGLAVILAFIGAKLILHALSDNNIPFVNGGHPVGVPEIGTGVSLSVIVGVLVVTVAASLLRRKGRAHTAIANTRNQAAAYLDSAYTHDVGARDRLYVALLDQCDRMFAIDPRCRHLIGDEPVLMELLERAAVDHDRTVARRRADPDRTVVRGGDDPVARTRQVV